MRNTVITAVAVAALSTSSVIQAETTTSFTFAPPPVTKPKAGSAPSNKVTFSAVSMESTTEGSDFSMAGWDLGYIMRGGKDKVGISLQVHIGGIEDDTGDISVDNLGAVGNLEMYLSEDKGTIIAAGVAWERSSMEFIHEVPYSYGSGTFEDTTYIDTTLVGIQASLQSRIPLNEFVGVTPYVVYKSMTGETEIDFETTDTTIDVSTLTFGIDVGLMEYSIAGMIQNTEDTSVTMITLGMNF